VRRRGIGSGKVEEFSREAFPWPRNRLQITLDPDWLPFGCAEVPSLSAAPGCSESGGVGLRQQSGRRVQTFRRILAFDSASSGDAAVEQGGRRAARSQPVLRTWRHVDALGGSVVSLHVACGIDPVALCFPFALFVCGALVLPVTVTGSSFTAGCPPCLTNYRF